MIDPGNTTDLKLKTQLLTEDQLNTAKRRSEYGEDQFKAGMGAEGNEDASRT